MGCTQGNNGGSEENGKVEALSKKEVELNDVLSQYSRYAAEWKDIHSKDQKAKQEEVKDDVLSSHAKNIILVLGQMLLPDGTPHEWMLNRLQGVNDLIKDKNFSFDDTFIVVSGGDVSNQKYKIDKTVEATNLPHKTEATIMQDILISKYKIPNNNIVREPEARTTIENFYFFLKLFCESGITGNVNLYVISSDWHINRAKVYFNILNNFERELTSKEKIIDNKFKVKTFEMCQLFGINNESNESNNRMEWIGIKSNATKERFEKEVELLKSEFLRKQAIEYRDYLWQWRDFELKKGDIPDAEERRAEYELFAKSTAIEHMYLQLGVAGDGLIKIGEIDKPDIRDLIFGNLDSQ